MWTRSGASGDPCTDEKSAPGEREKVVVRGEILQFGSLEVEQFRVTVRLTAVCGDGAWCVSGAPHVPPSLGLFNRMSWAVAPMGCSHCAAAETEVTGGELRDGQGATWRLEPGSGPWQSGTSVLSASQGVTGWVPGSGSWKPVALRLWVRGWPHGRRGSQKEGWGDRGPRVRGGWTGSSHRLQNSPSQEAHLRPRSCGRGA